MEGSLATWPLGVVHSTQAIPSLLLLSLSDNLGRLVYIIGCCRLQVAGSLNNLLLIVNLVKYIVLYRLAEEAGLKSKIHVTSA